MINIDTAKIKNCGEDIIKLSDDLNILLNDLYNGLNKVYKDGLWVGYSAINYIHQANREKQQMFDLKNSLYNIGKTLILNSDKYEESIKESIL